MKSKNVFDNNRLYFYSNVTLAYDFRNWCVEHKYLSFKNHSNYFNGNESNT